jgi:hypothetical protein
MYVQSMNMKCITNKWTISMILGFRRDKRHKYLNQKFPQWPPALSVRRKLAKAVRVMQTSHKLVVTLVTVIT